MACIFCNKPCVFFRHGKLLRKIAFFLKDSDTRNAETHSSKNFLPRVLPAPTMQRIFQGISPRKSEMRYQRQMVAEAAKIVHAVISSERNFLTTVIGQQKRRVKNAASVIV